MFGRPRCREWTPLATQQLRLRSLIQIVGYNIRPPELCSSQCSFYLTLHHTTMSAPFYTTEKISSPHPKWKEIDSEITQRMSSTNVVIRIWCRTIQQTDFNDSENLEKQQDTLIQTWGIYFSGMRYIGANLSSNFTSDCFKSNTLVFQMHGGYFCSYKSLKLDVLPPENEIEPSSLSSGSSGNTNNMIGRKIVQKQQARSISPSKFSKRNEKEYSKSQSPIERVFRQNIPVRSNSSLVINKRDGSCERLGDTHIYEHSPNNLEVKEFLAAENCDNASKGSREELSASKIDLSETAENYDLRSENDWVPKYRYMAIQFLKSELRPSYNASKLQKLHLLQYSIKKKKEAVQEIKERIYKKSALDNLVCSMEGEKLRYRGSQRNIFSPEIEIEFQKEKSASQNDISVKNGKTLLEEKPKPNGPRLTLKLNDLLTFKSKPSPFERSEHVRLTKQLEILRFKRIILSDERDSKLANIRKLKQINCKLSEENQDVGTELMQNYHTLSRLNESLKDTRQSCVALRDLAARSHAALANKRVVLLQQLLQDIFSIEQKDNSTWRICNVTLPICDDDNIRLINPISDSIAVGYAAQATCLTAAILNQPLRYKVTLLGSTSKILDITPDLPDPNIPLFARGGDLTLFRYAMFLLNKCIAQLLYARGLAIMDMRPTLANLMRLMNSPSNVSDTSKLFGTYKWLGESECPRTQSLRSLVASEKGKCGRQFNRFKESVDGHAPHTLMSLRRHSKSLGSYQDDNEISNLDTSTTSIMGSEPNIYNTKLTEEHNKNSLKSHNSDSEIAKIINDDAKVVFTLGDDDLHANNLVRISCNNDEVCHSCLDDNVKKICTEIKDYCDKECSDAILNSDQGIDIAKYMEEKLKELDMTSSKGLEEKLNEIDVPSSEYTEENLEETDVASSKNIEENLKERDVTSVSENCMEVTSAKSSVQEVILISNSEDNLDTGQDNGS